jgi:hypothetical protein
MTSVLESVRVPTYLPTYLLHHPSPISPEQTKSCKGVLEVPPGWMDVHFGWIFVRVIIMKKSDLKLPKTIYEWIYFY